MHELSIASSLLELARRHVPAGHVLRSVHVAAGPMRGIEPTAMEWAWRAAVAGTECERSELNLTPLPWVLRCPSCGASVESTDPIAASCACGCDQLQPVRGDALQLVSIDVDANESKVAV